MLERLPPQPDDPILRLGALFAADPRPNKVDLGVGVYRDAAGITPVMQAIRAAGARIAAAETTKTYTSLAGDPAFHAAMARLVLVDTVPAGRIAAVATPGGTGALRLAGELIRQADPAARLWLPQPGWPNHDQIFADLGLRCMGYRYHDAAGQRVDLAGMLADLGQATAGDIVLLHGCCHNPTGADPTPDEWRQMTAVLRGRGVGALVDLAYLGFGGGIAADAFATRLLAQELPELLIATSCSKSFGVYRERAGILLAVVPAGTDRDVVQGNLARLNRLNYSFPPDHGARLVQTVLDSPDLAADWQAELEAMRQGIIARRGQLAEALRRLSNSDRFDYLTRQQGMFSRLGLTPGQVARLRDEFGIYMADDSRVNLAGLGAEQVSAVARTIVAVL